MAERLEQLRGIIEEALFNLNEIIRDSTIRVNADIGGRLNQLNKVVSDNLTLLNSIAEGRIDQLNLDAEKRIEQISESANGLVEALPIPTQPLPKLPPDGFSVVRTRNGASVLYITGAGLRKGGTAPRAYLLDGTDNDKHIFSHNGTPLTVKASSMGLIELLIPQTLFPSSGRLKRRSC